MAPSSLIFIFGTSFIVGLSGAITPGPMLALNISEAARRGFWAGPLLVAGHAIVELVMVVALAWGLSRILGSAIVAGIIGVIGGLVLIWMAYSLLRQSRYQVIPTITAKQSSLRQRLVLAGVLVSIANPFWLLWWATVGSTYLVWSLTVGVIGVALFYFGHILSDLSWYSIVSLLVSRGRRFMNNTVYRWLLGICGLALLALGGYFLFSGIQFLVRL